MQIANSRKVLYMRGLSIKKERYWIETRNCPIF